MPKSITRSYLKEMLNYCPSTGVFTWKSRPREHFYNERAFKWWGTAKAGKKAGCVYSSGSSNTRYLTIRIKGNNYAYHRLAWLYMHGSLGDKQIDHIDGNGENNKAENLRLVTHKENHWNKSRNQNNTSGITGVVWNKATQKWRARIMVSGKEIPLGCFPDIESAAIARKQANLEYGFHANHGRG